MTKAWMATAAMICFVSVFWCRVPAAEASASPTTAPSAAMDPADEKATLEALKQKIKEQDERAKKQDERAAEQDRRIAELEARQDNGQKARREEIIAVLKEMNLLNDKKAGDMRVYYKDGLKFETADGNFRMGINGRIYDDWAWISAKRVSQQSGFRTTDGTELREARIMLSGDFYKDYFYCLELDFANETVAPKDIYMGMKNIPVVGNIRAGHFQEPFSLDDLLSDSTQTFMERSLTSALDGSPDRNDGIMANNAVLNERMTWAAGIFRPTNVAGSDATESDDGYHYTVRVTGLPYYANDGKQLIHLGAAYSYRSMSDSQMLLISEAPEIESGFSSKYVQTNQTSTGFKAFDDNLFGGEVAGVWNSFHAESEFMAAKVVADDNKGDPCFKGAYAQAGYFLTGETRPYNKATGIFSRLRPLKNFREGDGLGAWEVAVRYSWLDLNEDGIGKDRGEIQDVTLGLNWYLNPMIRIMWNYIHSMPDTVLTNGTADIFMMRFQIDF